MFSKDTVWTLAYIVFVTIAVCALAQYMQNMIPRV